MSSPKANHKSQNTSREEIKILIFPVGFVSFLGGWIEFKVFVVEVYSVVFAVDKTI